MAGKNGPHLLCIGLVGCASPGVRIFGMLSLANVVEAMHSGTYEDRKYGELSRFNCRQRRHFVRNFFRHSARNMRAE
jgi:hypothetical protein